MTEHPATSPPAAGAAAAIHDIGYRPHGGDRLGPAAVRFALFLDSLRAMFGIGRSARSKIVPWGLLLVATGPAVFVGILPAVVPIGDIAIPPMTYVQAIQILAYIFVATQVPAIVSRDLRYRVIALYLSRPLSRLDYVAAKLAAAWAATWILLLAPLAVLVAGGLLSKLDVGDLLQDAARTTVATALISAHLAVLAVLVASLTPRRGIGIAAIITTILVTTAAGALLSELGIDTGHRSLELYGLLATPIVSVDVLTSVLFGLDPGSSFNPTPDGMLETTAYAVGVVGVVVVLAAAVVLRYRRVRVS